MVASLPAEIWVGSLVSMVPKYAVNTWNCGKGCEGSPGLGSAGVCRKAAARKVCLPQASESRARTTAFRMGPPAAIVAVYLRARVKDPLREAASVWAIVILALAGVEALGLAVPLLRQITGALAVAAFLYVPARMLERRGQDVRDAGWRFDRLGADAAWALVACALVLPLFTIAFWTLPSWLGGLPAAVRALIAPYAG